MKQSISKIIFICLLALGFGLMQSAFADKANFKLYSDNNISLQLPKEMKGPQVKPYHIPGMDKASTLYAWGGGVNYQYANIIQIKRVPINNAAASQGYMYSAFLLGPRVFKSRMCTKVISESGTINTKIGKYNAKHFSINCQKGEKTVRINAYGILANNNAYMIELYNISNKNGFNQEAYNQVVKGVSTISLKK